MHALFYDLSDSWSPVFIDDSDCHTLMVHRIDAPDELQISMKPISRVEADAYFNVKLIRLIGATDQFLTDSVEWSDENQELIIKARTPEALMDRLICDRRGTQENGEAVKAVTGLAKAVIPAAVPLTVVDPKDYSKTNVQGYDADSKDLLSASSEILKESRFFWWRVRMVSPDPLKFEVYVVDQRRDGKVLASDIDGSISLVSKKTDYSKLATRVRGKTTFQENNENRDVYEWVGDSNKGFLFREHNVSVDSAEGWNRSQAVKAARSSANGAIRRNPHSIEIRVNLDEPHPIGTVLNAVIAGTGLDYVVMETRIEENEGRTIEETLEQLEG